MLSYSQLSDFFLDNEYTSFFILQQSINELEEEKFIELHKTKTTNRYKITEDGKTTLNLFINEINQKEKDKIDLYLKNNNVKMKSESSITSDITESSTQNYLVHLEISETKDAIFSIDIELPDIDTATSVCNNWKTKAQSIYSHIFKELL